MRVVAGRLRGRALAVPRDMSIRPTSDRVRQAVFDILEHGIDGFSLQGIRVFDLFAGTGALGIEAISRGALSCLFVDNDAAARALIRENITTLGLGGVTRVLRSDATALGVSTNRNTFSLIFLDPPYGKGLGEQALISARDDGWLEPGAIIVAEEAAASPIVLPGPDFELIGTRRYGQTVITIARFTPSASGTAGASPGDDA